MIRRLIFALAAALPLCLHAQVNFTGQPYLQNFDSLAGTTNNQTGVAWTNNSTLPGWYASKATYNVTNGTLGGSAAAFDATSVADNVGLFSFGSAGSAERALGARSTSQVAGNNPVQFGVRLVNTSGQTVTRISVAFRGEQWFASTQSAAHTLTLDYQLGASSLTGGTWTAVSALTFTAPVATGTTARSLDGNASANRRGVAATISGLSWAPGQELWIRINDANESGNEQGLAIDDFAVWTGMDSALHFDGRANYVTMGAATSALGASDLTLECWFLRTGAGETTSTGTGGVTATPLITKGRAEADGSNVDCNYFLGIDATGRLVADFEAAPATGITAGQNYPITGTTVTQVGVWYHVAATYDTATATWRLYLNGVQDATFTNPSGAAPRSDSIQHFGVGSALNSAGAAAGFFQGTIDEVRVWNVVRSAAEIAAARDSQIGSAVPGLRARYGFNEGTGSSAAGLVATAPAGTLTSAPAWTAGAMFAPNIAPSVTLTAPSEGGSAEAPATILFAATASDPDGGIAKVEFYAGVNKLGEDTSSPYQLTVADLPQGTYVFTARAIDTLGASTTSAPVSFTVTPSSNPPPSISAVAPASNATGLTRPVTLQVSVSDPTNEPLTVRFFGRQATPAPGADFTVVTLPDTQFYSENLNNRFPQFLAQTNWIVSQRSALNIAFVAHMGDMVQNGDNNGNNAEWLRADQAMDIIEQHNTTLVPHGIPWGGAPGNHDFGTGGGSGTTSFWNQFFGVSRWQGRPYFRGNYSTDNNNNYQFFSASGLDFMVINLAYRTTGDQATLDWADALMKANPHRRAIVTSHWIIGTGNPAAFGGQGQAIYDNLKDNPNFFLMLCGHIHGEGQRTDTFEGRAVHTVLQDYQSRSGGAGGQGGGDGWMRYFIFSPANNTISARTYRATTGEFETDADSQFALSYDMQTTSSAWVELGTANVAAGVTTASLVWTGLAGDRDYEWYAVVSDAVNQVPTSARRFRTAVNAAPSITLNAPAAGAVFTSPASINFTATASDDGSISRVEFFQGNTKVGEDQTAPYEFTWTGVTTGSYVLSAVAVDNEDATTLSNVVTVSVMNPANVPPTVSITTPVNGATFSSPASITINANATDTDGNVLRVEFFQGTTLIGEDITAPFSVAWNNVGTGSYTLTAKAFDNDGGVTTSAAVDISVVVPTGVPFSGSYSEDFNMMGSSGTSPPVYWSVKNGAAGSSNATWTTAITETGVAAMVNAAGALTASDAPTANQNNGYNAGGPGNAANRMLGSAPTSVAGMGFELLLTNQTAAPISALRIGYEIRRFTAATSANELPGYWLFYSLDNGATWRNVAELNPTLGGPSGVIVPNTAGLTAVAQTRVTLAAPWAAGANLHLRWVDDNAVATSPDQVLGLDNVFIAVPSADLAGLSFGAGALTPSFSSGTTAYTATVGAAIASSTLTATLEDPTASLQVRVNGGPYSPLTSGGASAALPLLVGTNTVEILVTASPSLTRTYTILVTRLSAYQEWAISFGLNGPNSGPADDLDGDGGTNLQEFAFGLLPTVSDNVALQVTGSSLDRRGTPIAFAKSNGTSVTFRAVFVRRRDFAAIGLIYTVQFSADLQSWENSTATPVVLAADAEIDAVAVPYPFFLSTGEKAQFFRVTVTLP